MSYNSFRNDNNGAGEFALIQFRKSNNFASVANLDLLGQILWSGYDAGTSTYKSASFIYCQAVGAPALGGNVPSELQFNTSFGTGTQLAMTIDQYGRVTINDPAINEATLVVVNNQTSPNINLRTANATATNSPHVHFTRSRAGTADVQASDDLGRLEFRGFQGGTAIEAADIRAQAETVNGASVSGSLQFRTRPTTYAAINTRMNISANGNVTVNAPTSGIALQATGVAGSVTASFIGTNTGGVSVTQANGGIGSFQGFQTSVDTQPVFYDGYKSRAGADINASDSLLQINAYGFRGGNQTAAMMRFRAESVGATRVSGNIDYFTTSTAGVFSQRMNLAADGFVTINAPAVTGQALTVNGFAGTANYAFVSAASVSAGLYQSSRFLNTNTTAGSGCRLDVAVNQQPVTTGGETFVRYINEGIQAISTGLNTATRQYVMGSGSTLAANPFFTFTISGAQINLPLQCCFHAWLSTAQNNVTGAGTYYDVIFQTERYDVSSSYNNTTGVFTAPATGKYLFTSQIEYTDITAAMTSGEMGFQVNAVTFVGGLSYINVGAAAAIGTFISLQNTCLMSLTAGDTVRVRTRIQNGAGDTADLAIATSSFFAGQLLS